MSDDHRKYLQGLVRMDIRKKERGLSQFAPKPGQPSDEADQVREKLEDGLRFRRQVLAGLDGGTATPEGKA